MSTPRRGLGRGLGSLIPTAPEAAAPAASPTAPADQPETAQSPGADAPAATPEPASTSAGPSGAHGAPGTGPDIPDPVPGASFAEIPLDTIVPNPRQPREVFEEESLAELVVSLHEVGLLQPVVVRRVDAAEHDYELIMGERRWRAAREAGWETIPAIVRDTSDDDLLRDALLENLHRAQLNPLEEAAAYQQMLDDFGCTQDELSLRIGRSRPQISNTLRLMRLVPAVQRRVAAGVLSAGHARTLLAVEDADRQEALAQRVVAEGISVRALEEIVTLGGDDERPRRSRTPREPDPDLAEIAGRLSERFETRVRVDQGRSKGKVTVEFASREDLRRILAILDPST